MNFEIYLSKLNQNLKKIDEQRCSSKILQKKRLDPNWNPIRQYFSWLRKLFLRIEGDFKGFLFEFCKGLYLVILRKEGSLPSYNSLYLFEGALKTKC